MFKKLAWVPWGWLAFYVWCFVVSIAFGQMFIGDAALQSMHLKLHAMLALMIVPLVAAALYQDYRRHVKFPKVSPA